MDTNTPTTIDAVKLVLGYGTALAAFAYGMGIAEEFSFLAGLGLTRDLNVADPVHFGYGGLLLAGTLWPLAFVIPLRAQRATFSRRAVVSILIACGRVTHPLGWRPPPRRVPHPFAFCAKGWAARTWNTSIDFKTRPCTKRESLP